MEIKVREVTGQEEKSVQEVEQELLEKHEEQFEDAPQQENETVAEDAPQQEETPQEAPSGLNEEEVLSYLRNRYDKQIDTVDQLFQAREESEELPEDVAAYLKYKKETGRGINDFVRVNRDLDEVKPDQLLRDYLTATEKGLDPEDIDSLMEDYEYDEDLDDDSHIKKVKLSRKKAIAKAKEYFEGEKQKYQAPLESSGEGMSEDTKEKLEAYNQYVQQSTTYDEELKRKQEWFLKQTDEVFSNEFKGFEFKVDEDKSLTFSPGDAVELKKAQSNAQNFISKFVDENGLIKDATGYHKALAIAMNPEKFAKFFYEQGKAVSADDVMRKMKNVDMTDRKTPEVTKQGGTQIRSLSNDSGRGLKIKSRKK